LLNWRACLALAGIRQLSLERDVIGFIADSHIGLFV
jgi:hypothetical protein